MRKRGSLTNPRHRRNPSTEDCDFCWAKRKQPCRQRVWNYAVGAYRPMIGSKVKVPHMIRGKP